jgi:Flp pilus assembly protein TadD
MSMLGRLALVLLAISILASPGHGRGADFSRDLADLGSAFAGARDRAKERLVHAPAGVEPFLLAAYSTADFQTRAGIIDVLAERTCEAALPIVLASIDTGSRMVREAQARLISVMGKKGHDSLRAIIDGPDTKWAAQVKEMLPYVVRADVERTLIAKTLGRGLHYKGQFAALLSDRDLAAPVLLEMVANVRGGYRFQVPVGHVIDMMEIRAYAVEALLDVGRRRDVPRIREVLDNIRSQRPRDEDPIRDRPLESLEQSVIYTLYALGDYGPAEDLVRQLRRDTSTRRRLTDRVRARGDLAMAYTRIGRFALAEKTYRQLLRMSEGTPGLSRRYDAYNMACVLSLAGKTDEALYYMRWSVRKDPWAVEAAMEDGDLAVLREAFPDLRERLSEACADKSDD